MDQAVLGRDGPDVPVLPQSSAGRGLNGNAPLGASLVSNLSEIVHAGVTRKRILGQMVPKKSALCHVARGCTPWFCEAELCCKDAELDQLTL